MIRIDKADYAGTHRLRISFSSGESGEINLAPVFSGDHRPVLQQLSEPGLFAQFHVEGGALVWENGADLSPEFLYEYFTVQQRDGLSDESAFERLRADGYM